MKKDKRFYKGNRYEYDYDRNVELRFFESDSGKIFLEIRVNWPNGYDVTSLDIPSAKKFSKALRKGLRRLER